MDHQLIAAVLLVSACGSSEPALRTGSGGGTEAVARGGLAVTDGYAVTDITSAHAHVGKTVTIQGTARDAKLAAAVVASDLVVYCLGVDSWPADVSGKVVTAHGALELSDQFSATPGPHGEASAGTDGAVWVLKGCTYDAR